MSSVGWQLLDKYFNENPYFISKHHLDSYNDFITKYIKTTVQTMNPGFVIQKLDKERANKLMHKIELFVGGKDASELFFDKPTLYEANIRPLFPNEARLKNLTYACNLYANVHVKYTNYDENDNEKEETVILKNVQLAIIPIMLHSRLCMLSNQPFDLLREMGECPYDQGGYFIVDGKEKVIVSQENNCANRIFVNRGRDPKYAWSSFIRCTSEDESVFPKTLYFHMLSQEVAQGKRRNAIIAMIPQIGTSINLFVLFRALGIESDYEILEYILGDQVNSPQNKKYVDLLYASIIDSNTIYTQQQALEYLAQFTQYNSVDNLLYILYEHLFPNVQKDLEAKARFLGYAINRIIKTAAGTLPETDRDNYMLKRVGISGFLMADVFKDLYNHFRNTVRTLLDNSYNFGGFQSGNIDIKNLVNDVNKSKVFTVDKLMYGLIKSLKGNWGLTNESSKSGISQDLSRVSYVGFISHLRRVNNPMDPSIKIASPHRLAGSQWGYMCPCESPDGASIGLIKNMALLCHITFNIHSSYVLRALAPFTIIDFKQIPITQLAHVCKLKVNNNLIGAVSNPAELVEYVKLLRRTGFINIFTSINWRIYDNEINIFTEGGRCARPLIIADRYNKIKKLSTSWMQLVKGIAIPDAEYDMYQVTYIDPFKHYNVPDNDIKAVMKRLEKESGCIEFIDVEESNTCMIAVDLADLESGRCKFTHCEIEPSTIFSLYSSTIPLSNHNQAPRNIFSGAQGKQAIGTYATNFNNRIDTMSYMLFYPQKPFVGTRYMKYLNTDKLSNGENLIVAIASYTGYNQEDSVIINKSSIERGCFNLTYFKSHISSEEEISDTERVIFANPATMVANQKQVELQQPLNYNTIDDNGMPVKNAYITEGCALVGKCLQRSIMDEEARQRVMTYKGKVEVANKTVSGFVDKVVVYKNNLGNREAKIRLRKWRIPELGDKAASRHAQKGVVGLVLPQEAMPFTSNGLVPDIIINPHAFPTRMTIAHLLEAILAKSCACTGSLYDGTAFEDGDHESVIKMLEQYGLDRHGDEIMYNGLTGEQMSSEIFIGPTFYYRLKHMVADKINYRHKHNSKIVGMTRQPTKGRGEDGGLRIGEMEMNVLLSHGIASFMKESCMERSDNYSIYVDKESGQMVPYNPAEHILPENSAQVVKVNVPYAFKLFLQEIQTLSINPVLRMDEMQEFDNELTLEEELMESEPEE